MGRGSGGGGSGALSYGYVSQSLRRASEAVTMGNLSKSQNRAILNIGRSKLSVGEKARLYNKVIRGNIDIIENYSRKP